MEGAKEESTSRNGKTHQTEPKSDKQRGKKKKNQAFCKNNQKKIQALL